MLLLRIRVAAAGVHVPVKPLQRMATTVPLLLLMGSSLGVPAVFLMQSIVRQTGVGLQCRRHRDWRLWRRRHQAVDVEARDARTEWQARGAGRRG